MAKTMKAFLCLSILLLFLSCQPSIKPQIQFQPGGNDVIATRGMVASAHPLASEAGIQILKAGGNAVDAALATAFVLNVVEAQASGLGGGGFMLIKLKNQTPVLIDYRETAPAKATRDFYYHSAKSFQELAEYGPNSICVPGMLAGLDLAREKFGTKNLADLLQPAISIAEKGFTVDSKLNALILKQYDVITQDEITTNIFLKDLFPLEAGEVLHRPNLARSFQLIATQGVQSFYRGEIARAIIQTLKSKNSILRADDLRNYQPIIRETIQGNYRGFEIFTIPPPSSGGVHLLQVLNILSGFNLRNLQHNSAAYISLFVEALKQAYADRKAYAADPAFYEVPVKALLSADYAREIQKKLRQNSLNDPVKAGIFQPGNSGNTTHISVVDTAGNMVALTQTINHFFGSGITVPEWGILLNDEMFDFSKDSTSKNAVFPGKRPVSSMAPTFVFKAGKPFLTIGTPGGSRIISALAQILVNIFDFGMSIDQAIEAPRFHCEAEELFIESRVNSATIRQLKKMGYTVTLKSDFDVFFGGAQGILIDAGDHKLFGGADSRRSGVVVGY